VTPFSDFVEHSSLVCKRSRVLYVPTPKAACTSLKWLFATFEDAVVPPEQTACNLETRAMAIHFPGVNRVDRLIDLDTATRNEVLTGAEWVRLGVTREPCERILSGWINRQVLVPYGGPLGALLDVPEDAIAGRGAAPIDLRAGFRKFVLDLDKPGSLRYTDPHFVPQAEVLEIDRIAYTDLVDVKDLESFVARLRSSSARRQGLGSLPRVNLSPSFPVAAMYDRETVEVVQRLHAADYERFGYRVPEPDEAQPPVLLNPNELLMIRELRERAQRIEDLAALAQPQPQPGIRAASRHLVDAIERRLRYELRVRGYRGRR